MVVVKGSRRRVAEPPSRSWPGPGCEVVASSAAWADYDIPGSPYFVLVEGGVVTGEGSATRWASVRDLLAAGRRRERPRPGGRRAHRPRGRPPRARRRRRRGGRDDLSRIDAELRRPASTPATRACTSRPTRSTTTEAAARVTALAAALVVGLPMAVLAAVRATWSP